MKGQKIAGIALLLCRMGWGQATTAGESGLVERLQNSLSHLSTALQAADTSHWHAERHARESFQSEAESIQRNLAEAAPGLLLAYRQAPDNLVGGIRLFRDLDAVEQAATQAAQLAAAYGPREQAEALAAALDPLAQSVTDLATALEQQAEQTQARLHDLEARLRTANAAPAVAAAPKSVVIDANGAAPARRTRKKKATHSKAVPPV